MLVEGYLTSSGVFAYPQEDGTILREWRPPGEVADATSIDSLRLSPVTIEHPKEQVTIDNHKDLAVGTVGDDVRIETQWPDTAAPINGRDSAAPDVKVRCRLVLTDARAIALIEAKELPEVSCGYTADLDMTPGVTPDGQGYDAVQRRIAYNHLAIGVVGRQGPGVSIRVDSTTKTTKEHTTMETIIIDGVSYTAPKQTIEAVQAMQRKSETKLAEAVAALDAEKKLRADSAIKLAETEARADGASAGEKKAQAEAKAAADRIKSGVRDRLSLERSAIKVMGAEAFTAANLGDADDDTVRVAVVRHVNPDRDLSSKAAAAAKGDASASAYIAAAFDISVDSVRTDAAADDDVDTTTVADSAGSLRRDSVTATAPINAADKARADSIAAKSSAWKRKV